MNARERLAIFLAVFVTIIWGSIAIASIITKEFTALTIITPLEFLVVGFAVGVKPSELFKKDKEDK